MNINSIRKDYKKGILIESEIESDPFSQFSIWLNDALTSDNPEPTAMTLSTIGEDGFPQSRVVLLKYTSDTGFIFFTNYNSTKGRSLELNNAVALNFFWPELQRQVRVTGKVTKTSITVSDEYFKSRPRNSRIGAWASGQSDELSSRSDLENRFEYYNNLFQNDEIPRPAHWGGYHVEPVRIEFWQGRENRLHDRLIYTKTGLDWIVKRLAP